MRRLTIALLAVASACSPPAAHPAAVVSVDGGAVLLADDAPQWRYVELRVAALADELPALPMPGRVEVDPSQSSNVSSPLRGRVDAVYVRRGDKVKQGDKLFSVRSGEWAELDREVEASHAALAVKQRVVERTRDLVALKATPEKELFAAEAELKEAELAVRAATARRSSLRVDAAGNSVFLSRAPREGTVVDLELVTDQEVSAEAEKPLVRIANLDEVIVTADAPESSVGGMKAGEEAVVRVTATGREIPGRIEAVSELVDPVRRTVELRMRVENHDRAMRPNGFVEVVPLPSKGVKRVVVPDTAVVTRGNATVVFVMSGPGQLSPVTVRTGRRGEGQVEIVEGLKPDTRYVARGALLLLNQVELNN